MGKQSSSSSRKEEEEEKLFVWKKKLECLKKNNIKKKKKKVYCFDVKSEKKKQQERLKEAERLRKRREDQVIQKVKLEQEKRLVSALQFQQDWEHKEEEERFLYQQNLLRSDIRLRQGRPKPIDLLRKCLHYGGDGVGGFPAYMVLKGLSFKDFEELAGEIGLNLDFDNCDSHFYTILALLVLCDWEISKAAAQRKTDDIDALQHKSRGLHSSIEEDVENLLKGKTHKELEDLHSQTESQLLSGNAKVVEFWEALLTHLRIYKAQACLNEIHAKLLSPPSEEDVGLYDGNAQPSSTANNVNQQEPEGKGEVINPYEEIEQKHVAVLVDQQRRHQETTMGKDDALLGSDAEVNLDSQVYYWSDKYQPRKPKYLIRVLTGYEWNKYNRTHYDYDNPRPKAVKGYRFNIMYPDLLDKSKAPQYIIEKDGSNVETCIIRFCAGPPYEDIAFRIVNKEWRASKKEGFKCTFEAGILRLYFNLQQYPYRR
ncbi:LOW QUALITY PROTEIN: hypothetical protein AQUCO_04000036v1 [Aquilegia coerulea]|uniref:Splicing factor Cactin n=1 Tax=Aquilegia coerulea TaxID=218851 RepID=A0A2G5CR09_AQUCA|nr:LOW QUALITY PROTEIN: hypothetical protein AQUCO_04000036v1 [Aquilegia coerulea]